MDELRAKLELKSYRSAQLYFDTENYQAAAVTWETCWSISLKQTKLKTSGRK